MPYSHFAGNAPRPRHTDPENIIPPDQTGFDQPFNIGRVPKFNQGSSTFFCQHNTNNNNMGAAESRTQELREAEERAVMELKREMEASQAMGVPNPFTMDYQATTKGVMKWALFVVLVYVALSVVKSVGRFDNIPFMKNVMSGTVLVAVIAPLLAQQIHALLLKRGKNFEMTTVIASVVLAFLVMGNFLEDGLDKLSSMLGKYISADGMFANSVQVAPVPLSTSGFVPALRR
jgi:hypothetical protein